MNGAIGKVRWFGIVLSMVLLASVFGTAQAAIHDETRPGALIIAVESDSPAKEAGLVRGDIIQQVDGEKVDSSSAFVEKIMAAQSGDSMALSVLHGDDLLDMSLELGELDGRPYVGVYLAIDVELDDGIIDQQEDEAGTSDEGAVEVTEDAATDTAGEAETDEAAEPDEAETESTGESESDEAETDEAAEADESETDAADEAEADEAAEADESETGNADEAESSEAAEADESDTGDADEAEASETAEAEAQAVEPDEQKSPVVTLEETENAALIVSVARFGPAFEAGLQAGDVLLGIDGERFTSIDDLSALADNYDPGDDIVLEVLHMDGSVEDVELKLAEHPKDSKIPFIGIRYVATPYSMFSEFESESDSD